MRFGTRFEQWLDPYLDAAWINMPKVVSVPIMFTGIVVEMFVFFLQGISMLFAIPESNKRKKKNPLSTNPLDDEQ